MHPAFVVRRLTRSDAAAIRAMAERCSAASLTRRFLGPARDPGRLLTRSLDASGRVDLGALLPTGEVVGVATLARGAEGVWEVALLVEDRWQRRRLGSLLCDALVEQAANLGVRHLRATTTYDARAVLALARRRAVTRPTWVGSGVLELWLTPVT